MDSTVNGPHSPAPLAKAIPEQERLQLGKTESGRAQGWRNYQVNRPGLLNEHPRAAGDERHAIPD